MYIKDHLRDDNKSSKLILVPEIHLHLTDQRQSQESVKTKTERAKLACSQHSKQISKA